MSEAGASVPQGTPANLDAVPAARWGMPGPRRTAPPGAAPLRAVAIVPVKGGAGAKSRLEPALGPAERERLVVWMLERVVEAARGAGLDVRVVGGHEPVALACRALGCSWSADRGGLNASVHAALREASGAYEAAVVLPVDLPWVRACDIEQVRGALGVCDAVVLVPSPDGGTNTLAVRLPAPITPSFGPGSFQRHARLATQAGLRVIPLRPPGLLRDIDEPTDLTPELLRRALGPPAGVGDTARRLR